MLNVQTQNSLTTNLSIVSNADTALSVASLHCHLTGAPGTVCIVVQVARHRVVCVGDSKTRRLIGSSISIAIQ